MQHYLKVLVVIAILVTPCVSRATVVEGNPPLWAESFGTLELPGDLIAGGGANGMSTQYDATTDIFQMTSNYLPGFGIWSGGVGNISFSLTATVSNTGVFEGGTYSMMVGPAGLVGLSLPTGTLLLSGTVLDLASAWPMTPSPGCALTSCQLIGDTPALLSVGFAAPELGLSTDFLTVVPYVSTAVQFNNPWSTSFHLNGFTGWTLWSSTVQVPEPATLSLFGLGLAGVVFMRQRRARRQAITQ